MDSTTAPLNQSGLAGNDASDLWAPGDFPPRQGVVVHPLIDGRAAMLAMCRAFLSARHYILLAGWDIRADLEMVRGLDARPGPEGGPEQTALFTSLRQEGLSDEALKLWSDGRLRVSDVLGFAVGHGVQVGVLLWDAPSMGPHITNDPDEQRAALEAVGVDCVLDSRSRKITHLLEALHQKCAVVDGTVAFAGGVDLTFQADGDYDRWDTHAHPPETPERGSARAVSTHPWHDAHMRIEGPAVADVQRNIVQRWQEAAERDKSPEWPLQLEEPSLEPLPGGSPAQIIRTIPPDTYEFAPQGIQTIYQAYVRAVESAQRYIYLESQYFWPEVYRGLDTLMFGGQSEEMSAFIDALAGAVNRGVYVGIVLPDHPNCGRRYTDSGITLLREKAPDAVAAGRFQVFTLGASHPEQEAPGGMLYRPVYVHAKVGIVDDRWLTVGSANLNNRGFRNDAELNVAIASASVARDVRIALWTEHLRASLEDAQTMHDIGRGFDAMIRQAQANLAHVGVREPLDGHLIPYLTFAEGQRLGISVDAEHGWLDSIEGGLGATAEMYRDRYL